MPATGLASSASIPTLTARLQTPSLDAREMERTVRAAMGRVDGGTTEGRQFLLALWNRCKQHLTLPPSVLNAIFDLLLDVASRERSSST